MKVEVKEGRRERKYPYIGESTATKGLLILFTEPYAGTVISNSDSSWELGTFSKTWTEEIFTPFTGSVTLSN